MKGKVDSMEFEQMLQLIQAVSDSSLTEFKYDEKGVKLSLKKEQKEVMVQSMVQAPALAEPVKTSSVPASGAQQTAKTAEIAETAETQISGNIVKSPLVGTFYAAPSEGAEAFVKVGDSVKEGQTLAIIEAMKLMNDIESDFTGTVAEILVQNGEAVEYGQPLFVIQ